MLAALFALPLALAALVSAAVLPRSGCSALGNKATDTLPERFNLTTRLSPKAKTTSDLYLHISGATVGQSWSVLVTTADTSFTGLNLTGGAMFAYASNVHFAPTAAIGLTMGDPQKYGQSGPWVTFATDNANPVPSFCAVPSKKKVTLLAMNGHTDMFSLCRSYISSAANGVTALVYDANTSTEPGGGSYDGASCVPVEVLIQAQSTK